jgi:hypothetical protein
MRVYFARLDKICGSENWSHTLTLSERGAVCSLTIFGVTKSACGDYPRDNSDENAATSAESQAFKRACTAFGLGRYLYSFPQTWAAYDERKSSSLTPPAWSRRCTPVCPKVRSEGSCERVAGRRRDLPAGVVVSSVARRPAAPAPRHGRPDRRRADRTRARLRPPAAPHARDGARCSANAACGCGR